MQDKLYDYSPENRKRILEQSPNASVVMSRTKWREVGRYPKQGANGIIITMPEYKDGNRTGEFVDIKVYDISETYGREFEKADKSINNVKGKDKPSVAAELREHKKAVDEGTYKANEFKFPEKSKDRGR